MFVIFESKENARKSNIIDLSNVLRVNLQSNKGPPPFFSRQLTEGIGTKVETYVSSAHKSVIFHSAIGQAHNEAGKSPQPT